MKNNVKEIEVKIEKEEFEKALENTLEKKLQNFQMDGFRKGKVPKDLYLKKYGKESLYIDAVDSLLPSAYDKALKDVKPIIEPKVDLKEINENGCTFVFTVTEKPEVNIKKYTGLKVKEEEAKVSHEEIEAEIDNMLERYSEIAVKEGKLENGNIAIIDFEGFNDGVAFEGGKGTNYSLEIGSNTFIPGFEEQLIGMEKNEEKEINVTFPKDYPSEDLKGKDVVFKVKVNEIKEKVRRELDKDFFEDLGMDGVDSLETLEKHVEEHLLEHKKMDNENKFVDEILAKIAENTEVEIPEEMVEHEITHMVENFENQLKMQGISLEVFYEMTKSDEKALRDQMKDEASKRVKYSFILEEIQNKENIKVTEEETNEKAETLAKQYGMEKDAFISAVGGLYNIEYELLMEKTINFLKENN